jgi:VWFA-related protein
MQRLSRSEMSRGVRLIAVLTALATGVAAQEFRSSVDLVTVPVVITGRGGSPVTRPITVDDFRVYEDGVEQTVTLLNRERQSTSLCIVLDSSMSMRGWKQRLASAAIDPLLSQLGPDDEVAVVTFSAGVYLRLPWMPVPKVPRVDWDKWKVGGTTPAIDALKAALRMMNDAVNQRSVVLIVSDGLDNSSRTTLSQIATTRRQSETLVYALRTEELTTPVPNDPSSTRSESSFSPDSPKDVLATLVGDSGGVVYSVAVPARAAAAARAFVADLEAQYILGYEPKRGPDGTYRRLKVEPLDQSWRVRHRGGYLSQAVTPR